VFSKADLELGILEMRGRVDTVGIDGGAKECRDYIGGCARDVTACLLRYDQ
jgi:hypothetical protein